MEYAGMILLLFLGLLASLALGFTQLLWSESFSKFFDMKDLLAESYRLTGEIANLRLQKVEIQLKFLESNLSFIDSSETLEEREEITKKQDLLSAKVNSIMLELDSKIKEANAPSRWSKIKTSIKRFFDIT